ncbi:hypothetical protein ACFOWA_13200 [Pedobacter lithocola]|uniref:Uncharacterized protein n=1 Tax=Pedobacter lithocola TaxID=1908239 RepID=A0ABV8PDJ3_9SPHI
MKKTKEEITTRTIYLAEIAAVNNNRFLTAAEKELKINELQQFLIKQK